MRIRTVIADVSLLRWSIKEARRGRKCKCLPGNLGRVLRLATAAAAVPLRTSFCESVAGQKIREVRGGEAALMTRDVGKIDGILFGGRLSV